MGQKIHPHGLRLGFNRKWNSTWYAEGKEYTLFFHAHLQLEHFLKAFLHLYPYVKKSATQKAALVDLKWFRAGSSQIYLFVFFYKFRTKKRRWNIIKKPKIKAKKFNFHSKKVKFKAEKTKFLPRKDLKIKKKSK